MVARSVRCRSSSRLPAGGEVERPVEALADRAQRHHRHLPRRQLDPERQPVQPAQHLDQVGGVLRGQLEVGPPAAGVLDERAHAGLPPQRRRGPSPSRGTGSGCSRTTYSPGTCSVTRDVASTRTPGALAAERDDELAAGVDHVLAVVEDQQQLAVGQRRRDLGRAGPRPVVRSPSVDATAWQTRSGAVDGGELDDDRLARARPPGRPRCRARAGSCRRHRGR